MGGCLSWRWLNASVAGTSHLRGNLPCQDDCLVDVVSSEGGEVLIAIASDGAGSAACAEEGSALACEALCVAMTDWTRTNKTPDTLTPQVAEEWVRCIRAAIETHAKEKNLAPRDFACTVVAAVVSEQSAAFLQIGDGAIVVSIAGAPEVVFWPDSGEYANMTFFVTDDDWPKHLHFEMRAAPVHELALMTDGLQRLALHYGTRTPHAAFFAPMFAALPAESGYAAGLEIALVDFLNSGIVNERTDDDKSLVIAVRDPVGAAHGDC